MDPSTSRIAESRNSGKSFTLSQQIDRSIVAIERWETEAQQAEDRMRFAQRQANAGRLHLHELEAQIPLGGAQ